jgi:hypothetical protein
MMSDEWKTRLKAVGIVGQRKRIKDKRERQRGNGKSIPTFGFLYLLCLHRLPNLPLGAKEKVENNRNSE